MIDLVTKTYVDENGDEHKVAGYDISKLPPPQEHDFYQEGRYVKCTCHAGRAKQLPTGKNLYKEGNQYIIR